jgi:phosphoribosyl 1,2-cyclic phosphodiesterase
MDFNITVLGSGSSGNSVLLSRGDNGILIDAGFSRKEILSRLNESGISPDIIKAILITHEHTDHVKGARVLADYLDIPTYTTCDTAQYLMDKNRIGKKKIIFDAGSPFNIVDFDIQPFRVSHDAIDPVGFIISTNGVRVGFAMDLGHLDRLTKCRLKGCDAIVMESNHDIKLLKTSNRPLRLIRRIAGNFGHLSNDTAISSLHELLTKNSRFLFLGHLSSECNRIDIVENMAVSKLGEINRTDVILSIMQQDNPLAPVLLG